MKYIHPDLAEKINRFSSPHIEHFTDLYNAYRSINDGSRKLKKASMGELQTVIGTMLLMGIVKLPNRKMYWGGVNTRNTLMTDNITRNRFDEIVSMLHFNNNSLIDQRDYKCHL